MHFYKFQALGNDFVIAREAEVRDIAHDLSDFSKLLCDRRFGAGADGLEMLLGRTANPEADFEVRLFNSDGGETPISGNGTRCVAAYIYMIEGWVKPFVRIATGAGVKILKPVKRLGDGLVFETDMGTPKFRSVDIPVSLDPALESVIGQSLDLEGKPIEFTAVSMGNPHCSIFVDDFDRLDWRGMGSKLEVHPAFPDRTNVEFVRVLNRDEIEVRFWERGCGETLASGTGACGAALAAMLNHRTERKVKVKTQSGELTVEWNQDGKVIQTGEARIVFQAEWKARIDGGANGR